ncbi:hypothetical protein PV326_004911, partial [Microctonus aethiopoides]
MEMDEVAKLEHLSLVSKICTELENHLGLNDKDLAEFIIHLSEENPTFEDFKKVLLENGAEFSDSFISNLLRIIQHMKPAKSSEKNSIPSNKQDELANKFPALAMANSTKSHSNIATYDNDDDDIVNDAMASLESFAPSSLKKPTENPSDSNPISKQEPEKKSNKSSKRERERSKDRRNRSRSPRRSRKHRSRSRSRDRRRHRSRDRHRSSSKDHYKRRGSHRERSPRRYNNKRSRSRSRSNDELSLDPEVGKIYSGKVENVVSFGCFVQLEGLKRRCEGLVHISQLRREGRVINASDVVSRGQKVIVK